MKEWVFTKEELAARQSLPLHTKVELSRLTIETWIESHQGQVYVAFSGGKDSTVLLHLTRQIDGSIPAVFVNTGLQYPEVRQFALSRDNVVELRPAKSFKQVIEDHGWPVVSKKVSRFVSDLQNPTPRNAATRNLHLTGMNRAGNYCPSMVLSKKWRFLVDAPFKISNYCCDVMKKAPFKKYALASRRVPIIGVMAEEGSDREKAYMRYGCLRIGGKSPQCNPLGFWTNQDVLEYIFINGLKYASVYGDVVHSKGRWMTTGERRTGCIFCALGIQFDGCPNRFQRLKITHPKLWDYCINTLGEGKVLDYIGVPYDGALL